MKGAAYGVRSPLAVGDTVRMNDGSTATVTDVLVIHSARRNDVRINYQLDGRRVVPLGYIRCRTVDGHDMAIGEEWFKSERLEL